MVGGLKTSNRDINSSKNLPDEAEAATRVRHAVTGYYHFGPFRVDVNGRRIWNAGREVAVRRRVFDLLVFLLQHPGEVITRERMLEEVWATTARIKTRTVDMHVSALRRAIEVEPGVHRYITTVERLGYRFDP